ncbi:hypothetical protein [Kitasatospora sp. CB01950]|uniref:hypothetical protein n=1 Tax=Kitasatospora sp. CB01950 TaxID=1703930 RepID=UPI000939C070|nr:hypothetical protein [Kitasatospora sp. CB01950]OKI95107.1 hypothetical protein AMK19_33100 [Kitasatospora sp. CB01950]
MHDPDQPAPHTGDAGSSDPGAVDAVAVGRVAEKIEEMAALLTRRLFDERRRPGADSTLVERLLAERAACAADRAGLVDADARELARIEALYDAKLAENTGR